MFYYCVTCDFSTGMTSHSIRDDQKILSIFFFYNKSVLVVCSNETGMSCPGDFTFHRCNLFKDGKIVKYFEFFHWAGITLPQAVGFENLKRCNVVECWIIFFEVWLRIQSIKKILTKKRFCKMGLNRGKCQRGWVEAS